MTGSSPPISVLTSGVGFGAYVPALLNQRILCEAGHLADVEVIEGYFTSDALRRHLAHREAFQKSFELARLARRMTKDPAGALDAERIDILLDTWAAQGRRRFIVWSGFWFSVLQRYIALVPSLQLEVDLCRIDAVASASFRHQHSLVGAECRDIWLWSWLERGLDWRIPVTTEAPIPVEEREARLVVHGGGWSLGDYTEVLPALFATGSYGLDVIAPADIEESAQGLRDRRFTPQPGWHPWQRDLAGAMVFPPLREVVCGQPSRDLRCERCAPVHGLVREAVAVVSKPGGGTLIDSLAAATPIVLLAPCGEAEARNGDLWEELGFGIRFERWRRTDFDIDVLIELHDNLLRAGPTGRMYPPEAYGAVPGVRQVLPEQ